VLLVQLACQHASFPCTSAQFGLPHSPTLPATLTLQHLYAPPTRRVLLYEPEQDRVVTRVPGHYSRDGKVVQQG